MTAHDDLETRLSILEADARRRQDLEDIKRVKYKYWRSMDLKLFDELAECFSEDAIADYGPKIKLAGKAPILEFLSSSMVRFDCVHHGHSPEIESTGPDSASGIWALYNYMIDRQSDKDIRIGGFYYDDYVREKGRWRIKSTKEVNVFRQIYTRST